MKFEYMKFAGDAPNSSATAPVVPLEPFARTPPADVFSRKSRSAGAPATASWQMLSSQLRTGPDHFVRGDVSNFANVWFTSCEFGPRSLADAYGLLWAIF